MFPPATEKMGGGGGEREDVTTLLQKRTNSMSRSDIQCASITHYAIVLLLPEESMSMKTAFISQILDHYWATLRADGIFCWLTNIDLLLLTKLFEGALISSRS